MTKITVDAVRATLLRSWSTKSSTKWTQNHLAPGQCGVTVFVVQDHLGRKVYKTVVHKLEAAPLWHCYNRVNGKLIDFTSSQCDEPVTYEHIVSERAEAFSDPNREWYAYLKSCLSLE